MGRSKKGEEERSRTIGHGVAECAPLAEAIANHVRLVKGGEPDPLTHIFATAPNALVFYLGQQHQAIAPCVVYEFDFDRRRNMSYQLSMIID